MVVLLVLSPSIVVVVVVGGGGGIVVVVVVDAFLVLVRPMIFKDDYYVCWNSYYDDNGWEMIKNDSMDNKFHYKKII